MRKAWHIVYLAFVHVQRSDTGPGWAQAQIRRGHMLKQKYMIRASRDGEDGNERWIKDQTCKHGFSEAIQGARSCLSSSRNLVRMQVRSSETRCHEMCAHGSESTRGVYRVLRCREEIWHNHSLAVPIRRVSQDPFEDKGLRHILGILLLWQEK